MLAAIVAVRSRSRGGRGPLWKLNGVQERWGVGTTRMARACERGKGQNGKTVGRGEWEAAGRRDELVDEAHEEWAWQSTQALRYGKSGVMRRR